MVKLIKVTIHVNLLLYLGDINTFLHLHEKTDLGYIFMQFNYSIIILSNNLCFIFRTHGFAGSFIYCNIIQILFFIVFEFWDESFNWTPLHDM